MRLPIITGNWKMNTSVAEAYSLVRTMLGELDSIKSIEKVICPPFISLVGIRDLVANTSIQLGAQNMYFEKKGAYTGEVSPLMLKDLCNFVILGHSERRKIFGETNEIINKKIKAAFQVGLIPIFCVGEQLEENESGNTEKVISEQLSIGLKGVEMADNLIIAYEPVWAIGTGKAATGDQAENTIRFIRNSIRSMWNETAADKVRILYGGSVTASNIAEFVSKQNIDGALVGGASLNPAEFVSIVKQTSSIKSLK